MKLPSLSFFKKGVPKEYFLALLLKDETLSAIVFEEDHGTIHIVGEGKQQLPAPIDDTSFDELLNISDKAISTAEESLPNNIQSHKTIFGVKNDWTEDLQINKDHLITLKKLCEELELQPIGFLVFAEAIAHLLQKEEGAPVSAILVELGTQHINATLIRAGRVVANKQATIAENLPKAVDALLMKFSDVEILPSRIVILDHQKRPHLIQQFTNHSWSKQLPFLHVPQVNSLPQDFEKQAILFGTATQMGFDMLGLPEVKKNQEAKIENQEEKMNESEKAEKINEDGVAGAEGIPEARSSLDEVAERAPTGGKHLTGPQDEENKTYNQSSSDNFGFVKDKDVLEEAPDQSIAFDNFKTPDNESIEEFANETFADIPEEVKEEEEGLQSKLPGLGFNAFLITKGMKNIFAKLRKVSISSLLSIFKKKHYQEHNNMDENTTSLPFKKALLLIPVLLILVIGSIVWYIFGVKATATLFINPKNVEKSQDITFSSTDGTDISSDTIGATVVPITENGNTSTSATGSQDIGDKAKGTVTIYNNDDTSHTINAGTTITSSNGLKFITTKDVTVASASGDIFTGTKPGTQSVDVNAADIGTEYNLPSGTKFAFGSSTIIAAKNDTAFSGGTKKTVTVVSQKDLDKLTSDLTNTLGDKAKQDAQNNAGEDKMVLSTFLSTDVSSQKFDHKIGDQTNSVSLVATITYQALSYNKSDLDKIAMAILQNANQGEDISPQNISENLKDITISKDKKSVNATFDIKANLFPKIDTTKVAQTLAGKSFAQANSSLSDIPQLVSVQGILSPNFFFLPKNFPRIASHITVGIKSND